MATKIHILCDRLGYPLGFQLSGGQAHESKHFESLLEDANEKLVDGQGEPVAWPIALAGDKGYRAKWIDEHLMDLGIIPVIPSKENEDCESRPCEFDREAHRDRNIVERLIGWLKESRRILSRYEKTAINYGGMIKMAFIRQHLSYDVKIAF